jgi:hypothetical protein
LGVMVKMKLDRREEQKAAGLMQCVRGCLRLF